METPRLTLLTFKSGMMTSHFSRPITAPVHGTMNRVPTDRLSDVVTIIRIHGGQLAASSEQYICSQLTVGDVHL